MRENRCPRLEGNTRPRAADTSPQPPPPPGGGGSQETGSEPAAPLGLGGRLGSARALSTRSRVVSGRGYGPPALRTRRAPPRRPCMKGTRCGEASGRPLLLYLQRPPLPPPSAPRWGLREVPGDSEPGGAGSARAPEPRPAASLPSSPRRQRSWGPGPRREPERRRRRRRWYVRGRDCISKDPPFSPRHHHRSQQRPRPPSPAAAAAASRPARPARPALRRPPRRRGARPQTRGSRRPGPPTFKRAERPTRARRDRPPRGGRGCFCGPAAAAGRSSPGPGLFPSSRATRKDNEEPEVPRSQTSNLRRGPRSARRTLGAGQDAGVPPRPPCPQTQSAVAGPGARDDAAQTRRGPVPKPDSEPWCCPCVSGPSCP